MMEAKKKYEKPAFRLVTDLGSILECLYEVYGTDGTMLIAGNKLSDTVIYPFIRMIKKKCNPKIRKGRWYAIAGDINHTYHQC